MPFRLGTHHCRGWYLKIETARNFSLDQHPRDSFVWIFNPTIRHRSLFKKCGFGCSNFFPVLNYLYKLYKKLFSEKITDLHQPECSTSSSAGTCTGLFHATQLAICQISFPNNICNINIKSTSYLTCLCPQYLNLCWFILEEAMLLGEQEHG